MEFKEGLTQRKSVNKSSCNNPEQKNTEEHKKYEDFQINLIEEILLLELVNTNGNYSFWSNSISTVLRGCILIELALRDCIELEKSEIDLSLIHRKIIIKSAASTDNVILDESLKYIQQSKSLKSVYTWIQLLSGEIFSFRSTYRIFNLRERVGKSLKEKGLVTIEKRNYFIFDLLSFPLANNEVKINLTRLVYSFLIENWSTNFEGVDRRTLAFILMAYVSNILGNTLATFGDESSDLAEKRLQDLCSYNYVQENKKPSSASEVIWAVYAACM